MYSRVLWIDWDSYFTSMPQWVWLFESVANLCAHRILFGFHIWISSVQSPFAAGICHLILYVHLIWRDNRLFYSTLVENVKHKENDWSVRRDHWKKWGFFFTMIFSVTIWKNTIRRIFPLQTRMIRSRRGIIENRTTSLSYFLRCTTFSWWRFLFLE